MYNVSVPLSPSTFNMSGIVCSISGLVPRLLGEALTIWLANLLAQLLNQYVLPKTSAVSKPNTGNKLNFGGF